MKSIFVALFALFLSGCSGMIGVVPQPLVELVGQDCVSEVSDAVTSCRVQAEENIDIATEKARGDVQALEELFK